MKIRRRCYLCVLVVVSITQRDEAIAIQNGLTEASFCHDYMWTCQVAGLAGHVGVETGAPLISHTLCSSEATEPNGRVPVFKNALTLISAGGEYSTGDKMCDIHEYTHL